MNSHVVTRELAGWLITHIGELGFNHDSSSEYVVRQIPAGQQSVGIAVWDRSFGVEFSLLVSIRIDAVEAIYHRFSGALPEDQSLSKTVVTPFSYFAGTFRAENRGKNSVSTYSELDALLKSWESPLRNMVVPYLEAAVDAVSLDHFVNVTHETMNISNLLSSYLHALILARVANNPDFPKLPSLHRPVLRAINCDMGVYETVLEYLTTH